MTKELVTERVVTTDFSITETTYKSLKEQLEKLVKKRGENTGVDTDYTSALHDDAAVVREMQFLDGTIDKLRTILKNCEILPIRTSVDTIDVGNNIEVKFETEDEKEVYRIGTRIDASCAIEGLKWISIESPLGKELIGKKKGETISYKVGDSANKVKILSIMPEEVL